MMVEIERMIANCDQCNAVQNQQPHETLKPTPVPDLPWVEIAADIFDREHKNYLLIVDYFSKFIEISPLSDMSTQTVIHALRQQLCCRTLKD
jgi:hypothetical protein